MVKHVTRSPLFLRQTKHLNDQLRQILRKVILKILSNPDVGKPLRHLRNERVLRIPPFRVTYSVQGNTLTLLKFEHRDSVYERR